MQTEYKKFIQYEKEYKMTFYINDKKMVIIICLEQT